MKVVENLIRLWTAMNVPIAQIKERSYKVAEEPEIAIIKFDKNE